MELIKPGTKYPIYQLPLYRRCALHRVNLLVLGLACSPKGRSSASILRAEPSCNSNLSKRCRSRRFAAPWEINLARATRDSRLRSRGVQRISRFGWRKPRCELGGPGEQVRQGSAKQFGAIV